jgi:hypothetical protein
MGNGRGKAGMSFGGFQPADPTPAPGPVQMPWALKYDGATADFVMLEDGSYDEVHPVTHETVLRVAVKLGAIPVTPEMGSTLTAVKIANQAAMTIDARRRIEQALDDLIADKKIKIDGVRALAPNRWRMKYEFSFTNLVETRADQRLQRFVFGDSHG